MTEAIHLVVRRGALRRFHYLKQNTASLPVQVSWDRRRDERRAASGETNSDRRKTERRQDPSFTWELADFVVIAPVELEPANEEPAK
ncbi:MAG TPA: hypothetical protein VGZ27_05425 [Vicinamibacterales bacterium]|jgi:hypothetical protein|nr:hypothetical protein [Vicinamibacterales bacterium]